MRNDSSDAPSSEDLPNPRSLALRRVSVREYSPWEMKKYLSDKGYDDETVETVVAELIETKQIDETRYARAMTRDQAMRKRGPLYILNKLRTKGVRLGLKEIEVIFHEVAPEDEETLIMRVLERRYPQAQASLKDRSRAYQGLLRRGFSRGTVEKCLRKKAEK